SWTILYHSVDHAGGGRIAHATPKHSPGIDDAPAGGPAAAGRGAIHEGGRRHSRSHAAHGGVSQVSNDGAVAAQVECRAGAVRCEAGYRRLTCDPCRCGTSIRSPHEESQKVSVSAAFHNKPSAADCSAE